MQGLIEDGIPMFISLPLISPKGDFYGKYLPSEGSAYTYIASRDSRSDEYLHMKGKSIQKVLWLPVAGSTDQIIRGS